MGPSRAQGARPHWAVQPVPRAPASIERDRSKRSNADTLHRAARVCMRMTRRLRPAAGEARRFACDRPIRDRVVALAYPAHRGRSRSAEPCAARRAWRPTQPLLGRAAKPPPSRGRSPANFAPGRERIAGRRRLRCGTFDRSRLRSCLCSPHSARFRNHGTRPGDRAPITLASSTEPLLGFRCGRHYPHAQSRTTLFPGTGS